MNQSELSAVRDIRQRREDTARAILSEAAAMLSKAQGLRAEARTRLRDFDAYVNRRVSDFQSFALSQGVAATDFMAAQGFHQDLRARRPRYLKLIEQTQRAVAQAERDYALKRADWTAARRAVEALDAIMDELRLEELKARFKREESAREELATLRQRRPA